MGKSLSLDIRERVVVLVDEGVSRHEAARRLRIAAQACDLFPPEECPNLFKAAGYVAD